MRLLQSFLLICAVSLVVGAMPQRLPSDVERLLSEAGALVQSGRLEEADAATRKILASYPEVLKLIACWE